MLIFPASATGLQDLHARYRCQRRYWVVLAIGIFCDCAAPAFNLQAAFPERHEDAESESRLALSFAVILR